jgi:MFS transporter, UMF1 family
MILDNLRFMKMRKAWVLYDFANSAYGSIVPFLLFPIYYKTLVLHNSPNVDLWWGIAAGVSILLSGLILPFLGTLADAHRGRKKLFVITTLLAIFGTVMMAFSLQFTAIVVTIIFILTNICYNIALSMYDSFLVDVSGRKTAGKISGLGWGLGAAGGMLCTLLLLPFLRHDADASWSWAFIIIAAFYFLFSLPALLYVKEKRGRLRKINVFSNTIAVLKNWRKNKSILLFLIAFYFFSEGIVTLSYFASLYATTTLKISILQLTIVFLISQAISFPMTIIAGKWSSRWGFRNIMIYTSILFCITIVIVGLARSIAMVYLFAVLSGFVVGVSQATARAWFSTIISKKNSGQLFGFNALTSKISSTIGPILFGIISVSTNQRIAVFSIIIYFIISLAIFLKIPEP